MKKLFKAFALCPESRMAILLAIAIVCTVLLVVVMFVLGCLEGHGVMTVDKRVTMMLGCTLHASYRVVVGLGLASAAAPAVWLVRLKIAEAMLAFKWFVAVAVILGGLALLSVPLAFVVELDIDDARIAVDGMRR